MYQKYRHSKITLGKLKFGLFMIVAFKLVMDYICCFKPGGSAEWGGFLPQRPLDKVGSREVVQLMVPLLTNQLSSDLPTSSGASIHLRDILFLLFHLFEMSLKFGSIWNPQLWGSQSHQQPCHIFIFVAEVLQI